MTQFYLFCRCGDHWHPVGFDASVRVVHETAEYRMVENQYKERFMCLRDESTQFAAFKAGRARQEYRKTLKHYNTPRDFARELVARL